MSKRGFWFGLLTGLVIVGLLVGTVAVVMLGARWASGSRMAFRGRSFGFQPGEQEQCSGICGRGGRTSARSHLVLVALLCCPALLFILGGVALAAYFGKRGCWHHPGSHHAHYHEGEPVKSESAQPASEPQNEEEFS